MKLHLLVLAVLGVAGLASAGGGKDPDRSSIFYRIRGNNNQLSNVQQNQPPSGQQPNEQNDTSSIHSDEDIIDRVTKDLDKIIAMFEDGKISTEEAKRIEEMLEAYFEPSGASTSVGIVLVLVGLLLAFTGRSLFKFFLSLTGFIMGACGGKYLVATHLGTLLAFIGLMVKDAESIKKCTTFIYSPEFSWGVLILMGVLGAFLLNKAWKIAVYLLSAFGAVLLGTSILLQPEIGPVILTYVPSEVFYILCAALGLLLARYFDAAVIISTSALIGASVFAYGLDMINNTGFRFEIIKMLNRDKAALLSKVAEHMKSESSIRTSLLLIAAVTVAGIYVQYRNQPRDLDK